MSRPPNNPDLPRQTKAQAIATIVDMLDALHAIGKHELGSGLVMQSVGCSKPTALSYLKAARVLIMHRGEAPGDQTIRGGGRHPRALRASPGASPNAGDGDMVDDGGLVTTPMAGLPTVAHPNDRRFAMGTGWDMMGVLRASLHKLEDLQSQVRADLEQVRFIIYGGPDGNPMPGLCVTCNKEVADRVPIKATPKELAGRLGINDITRLYEAFIKAEKEIISVAEAGNDALDAFVGAEARNRFMDDVEAAIMEEVPASARAIAQNIRARGMARGDV
jgi:hypothetical protein